MKTTVWALLALLLTGCATFEAERRATAEWQALADQVTQAQHVGHVYVHLQAGAFARYECGPRMIVLGNVGNIRWVLAHELGHHVRGHCSATLANEMEANRLAVTHLQIWGVSERDAVLLTVGHLLYLKRLRGDNQVHGHNFCAEAADLLAHYPAYPDPRAPGDTTCR